MCKASQRAAFCIQVCPLQFSREAYLRQRVIFVFKKQHKSETIKPNWNITFQGSSSSGHVIDNQVTGFVIMSQWGINHAL